MELRIDNMMYLRDCVKDFPTDKSKDHQRKIKLINQDVEFSDFERVLAQSIKNIKYNLMVVFEKLENIEGVLSFSFEVDSGRLMVSGLYDNKKEWADEKYREEFNDLITKVDSMESPHLDRLRYLVSNFQKPSK